MDDNSNGFQMFGMIQAVTGALKTGDVQTDLIIAMAIPFLLRWLLHMINRADAKAFFAVFAKWWETKSTEHHRYITYKCTRSSWGSVYSMDNDSQNSVLLKAIRLYIDQVLKLKLNTADLVLTGTETAGSGYSSYNSGGGYDSDDDSDSGGGGSRRTMVGMLSRYKIMQSLPDNEWHNLGCFNADGTRDESYDPPAKSAQDESAADWHKCKDLAIVRLRVETETESENDDNNNNNNNNNNGSSNRPDIETTRFHFVSPKEGAVDAFINTAYKWYLDQLRKMEDNARYYYELKVSTPKISLSDSGSDGSDEGAVYKRYKLSNQKTFDSLFFQEKESLLSLIGHFTDRTGKYSIAGYPHKLGVMLHGPPGTGKTSLIKALAHHTGRSIINVPLSKVSTNAELMSIFFDKKYRVEDCDVAVRLNFKDVIFVMEDVDAASKVVKRRDGQKTADVVQTETISMPLPKSMWRMLLESNDSDCRELVELLMEKSERLRKEAQKPEVIRSIAQRLMSLPGLGLVGEGNEDATLAKLSDEAIDAAETMMRKNSTVDQFVSAHAKAIKALVEAGTEIDGKFVDELLGLANDGPISLISSNAQSQRGGLSRNVSYTKYNANGSGSEEIRVLQDGSGGAESDVAAGMSEMLAAAEMDFLSSAGGCGGSSSSNEKGTSALIGPSLGFGRKNKDALSLAGLLNVLDGVVDTPGRMLIMTTNHPEQLDPALVRPGRIDKKIMLGYMMADDVVNMLQHYFQTDLTAAQKAAVHDTISSDSRQLKLTPAQVEQMTAEHEDVDEMIDALKAMAQPRRQHKTKFATTSMATVAYGV